MAETKSIDRPIAVARAEGAIGPTPTTHKYDRPEALMAERQRLRAELEAANRKIAELELEIIRLKRERGILTEQEHQIDEAAERFALLEPYESG